MPLLLPAPPALIRPYKPPLVQAVLVDRAAIGTPEWLAMFHAAFWLKPGSATRTFTDNTASAGSGASFTFASRSLGSPQGSSLVVVLAHCGSNGTGLTSFSSISIDGGGATIQAQTHGGAAGVLSEAVSGVASGATGNATGNIVVTPNANAAGGCAIEIYRLNFLISTSPDATATANTGAGTGTSVSTTINITGLGVLLLGANVYFPSTAPSGSGATQDVQQNSGGGGVNECWAGSAQNLATQSNRAISASWTGSAAGALAAACWH